MVVVAVVVVVGLCYGPGRAGPGPGRAQDKIAGLFGLLKARGPARRPGPQPGRPGPARNIGEPPPHYVV